ncbi:MAG TPA: tetratricopeptide repeat protein [Verrucomicrobiae bacterium]|nr:tetratricopeptide repeat protein [Verrucomicrobiae bacterium]
MQPFCSRCRFIFAAALAAVLAIGAGGWWLCVKSDSTAFLPAHAGAEWIMDVSPGGNSARPALSVSTVFKKSFLLDSVPGNASVNVSAFKTAVVRINGQEASGSWAKTGHWKAVKQATVTGLLHAGTNEITVSVTNSFGPSALWLKLTADNFSLGTDGSWESSTLDNHWLNARLAAAPPVLPEWSPLHGPQRTIDSLRHGWKTLLSAVVGAGLLISVIGWRLRRSTTVQPEKYIWLLFGVIIAVRAALFLNDIAALPATTGFDAEEHAAYVQFIQEHKALPLPNDGWEMHQPPLYYLGSALWLDALGLKVAQPGALLPLHAVNGIIGLLQCWVVLLCLRRMFPGQFSAQAAGMLVAAFLPPNLYLSLYVTNDPLAGLLVSAAFYFFLRWQAVVGGANKFAAGIGLALGAAVLTKLNSALVVPVFFCAMALHLLQKKTAPAAWWRHLGIMLAALVLACGWHYVRAWIQIGTLPLPNSQTNATAAWWQEPGFRTAGYYFHFGHSLSSPLFSGMNSFADGIYSTLWGDGLISGWNDMIYRPAWNYDLMNFSILLGLFLTGCASLGLIISLRKLMPEGDPVSLLVSGTLAALAVGIIFLTLHGPWLAHVKAFYALPGLVPFCAVIATGWIWLAAKGRVMQTVLWTLMLVWAFTSGGSFWIQSDSAEYWRSHALVQLEKQDYTGAVDSLTRALQQEPANANDHCLLAKIFIAQGKTNGALEELSTALKIQPDFPDALDTAAAILSQSDQPGKAHAVELAQRACDLTGFRQAALVTTLAAALDQNGQRAEALATARTAWELALQNGDKNLLKQNWEFINQRQQQP